MSYFAKPNFIVYDEWFDNDLKITIPDDKKITNISTIHEFFYVQSSCKAGASENNLQIDFDIKREELFKEHYFENNSEKYASFSNKEFLLFKKISKNKLKLNTIKKIIYSLSIFGFIFILVFLLSFISQSKKIESNATNKLTLLEKRF